MSREQLAKPNANWQERVAELCDPGLFGVDIYYYENGTLSAEEHKRLYDKLRLIESAARLMAAGMLKGVLKYPTDDYSLDTWLAHVEDDVVADGTNYLLLLIDKLRKEQAR